MPLNHRPPSPFPGGLPAFTFSGICFPALRPHFSPPGDGLRTEVSATLLGELCKRLTEGSAIITRAGNRVSSQSS